MPGLSHEQKLVAISPPRHVLDKRKDPIGQRNSPAMTALGCLDFDPLRSGSLHDEKWHRHFDEVTDTDRTQLRPSKSRPACDEEDVSKPRVPRSGRCAEVLELLLAERMKLDDRGADLRHSGARHGVEGDHALADRPGKERRQRRSESTYRCLREALTCQRHQYLRDLTISHQSQLQSGKGRRHQARKRRVGDIRLLRDADLSLLQPDRNEPAYWGTARARVDAARHGRTLASQPRQSFAPRVECLARDVLPARFQARMPSAAWQLVDAHAATRSSQSNTSCSR